MLNPIQKDWIITECRFAGVDETYARQLLEKILATNQILTVPEYISLIVNTYQGGEER